MSGRSSTYGSLAARLREAILRGDYAGGLRLPTEAELAMSHAISRQTVRRAMQDLVTDGLVYRVPGRGTYAVDESDRYLRPFGSVEDLMSLSVDTECEIIAPLSIGDDPVAAARLELDIPSVATVAFVRRHGTTTFCHTRVCLPPDLGHALQARPELAAAGYRSTITVIGLVDTVRHIRQAEQDITATRAPDEVARQLAGAPGDPVLRVERIYRDARDVPVELAVSHYDPAHFSYRVRLRRHPR